MVIFMLEWIPVHSITSHTTKHEDSGVPSVQRLPDPRLLAGRLNRQSVRWILRKTGHGHPCGRRGKLPEDRERHLVRPTGEGDADHGKAVLQNVSGRRYQKLQHRAYDYVLAAQTVERWRCLLQERVKASERFPAISSPHGPAVEKARNICEREPQFYDLQS